MTMKGGSSSKTVAAASRNKGRLKPLKSNKPESSSADSDVNTARILQSQRKKIMAVNAFEQEKCRVQGRRLSQPKISGLKEAKVVPKAAASKPAAKGTSASAAPSKSGNSGTKNVTAAGAKPRMFVRHNSTPAVIPLDKKVVTRKSALKASPETGRPQRKKSASAENLPSKTAKSVRIDDVVEVRAERTLIAGIVSPSRFHCR